MPKARLVAWMVTVGMMVLGVGAASGQTASTSSGQAYPTKPIRIVTAPIGAGNDFVSRVIAQGLSGSLGQQLVVDNRPAGLVAKL